MNMVEPGAVAGARSRMYRMNAERILRYAREQGLQPGARLPSERDLAALLAISRTSLREAIVALEFDGVVEVRVNTGIFLRQLDVRAVQGQAAAREVAAARRVIGVELAALAARHASGAQADAILAAAHRAERGIVHPRAQVAGDTEFVFAIAGATGNRALAGVAEVLWGRGGALPCAHALALQRAVHGAIAANDQPAARQAMKTYLDHVAQSCAPQPPHSTHPD